MAKGHHSLHAAKYIVCTAIVWAQNCFDCCLLKFRCSTSHNIFELFSIQFFIRLSLKHISLLRKSIPCYPPDRNRYSTKNSGCLSICQCNYCPYTHTLFTNNSSINLIFKTLSRQPLPIATTHCGVRSTI